MKSESQRRHFAFNLSYFKSIDNLPESMQVQLYRAIARYSFFFEEPDFSKSPDAMVLAAIWEGFLPNLKISNARYLAGCKGGAPLASHNNPAGRRTNQELTKSNQELTKNLAIKNKEERKKKKEVVKDEVKTPALVMPYSSTEFISTWNDLRSQPKWKKKSLLALQKSLDKLARYEERFAVELMITSIANDYQGVVFPDSDEKYEKWKQNQHATSTTYDGQPNCVPIVLTD